MKEKADKQATAETIAQAAGVSKSTVSKALNNCAGIDAQVKDQIVRLAKEQGYAPKNQQKHAQNQQQKIGIIMPANPSYFWKEAMQGMSEAARRLGILCIYSLYSKISEDETDIVYCVEYLRSVQADLYIVVPSHGEKAARAIEALTAIAPVVYFNNSLNTPHLFFVGPDAEADGAALARASAALLREKPRLLVVDSSRNQKAEIRKASFLQEARRLVPELKVAGEIAIESQSLFSSMLAREIHQQYQNRFDCIYVVQGIVPRVCLALVKLKLAGQIPCIGYEYPAQSRRYLEDGTIWALSVQRIRRQGQVCIEAAARYLQEQILPADRAVTVPSYLIGKGIPREKNTDSGHADAAVGYRQQSQSIIGSASAAAGHSRENKTTDQYNSVCGRKEPKMKKVKIGVFGAGRGQSMIDTVSFYEEAELVAVCDQYEPLLRLCAQKAEERNLKVTCYTDFEEFFRHDMDAVILANFANEHAPYAIRLLNSGRHVASEVLAVKDMAEAVALTEAVEQSGKVYAYLENYCYFPATTEMRNLYRAGRLGEFQHGEGEYIHDCEGGWAGLTYGDRTHWRNTKPATFYNTHSLGPIIHITGTRPVRVIGIENVFSERQRNMGKCSAEGCMEILQMDNGAMVKSIHGGMKREPASVWYAIYGSKGMAESDRWSEGTGTVYLYQPEEHTEMVKYQPKPAIESDLAAKTLGHGGSDFYTVHYFIQKILGRQEGIENSIDIYEALDMCIPGLLAHRSVCNGSIPIDVPNFRNKEEREAYRNDTWSTWGEGKNKAPYTRDGNPEIPDAVYDRIRQEWLDSQKQ